jgi:hypothetical protein
MAPECFKPATDDPDTGLDDKVDIYRCPSPLALPTSRLQARPPARPPLANIPAPFPPANPPTRQPIHLTALSLLLQPGPHDVGAGHAAAPLGRPRPVEHHVPGGWGCQRFKGLPALPAVSSGPGARALGVLVPPERTS